MDLKKWTLGAMAGRFIERLAKLWNLGIDGIIDLCFVKLDKFGEDWCRPPRGVKEDPQKGGASDERSRS